MKEILQEKYAELIIKKGLNLQKDQPLLINASINLYPFVRVLVKKAYEVGAKWVDVNYRDPENSRQSLIHESIETLSTVPDHVKGRMFYAMNSKCARLSLYGEDPEFLKGIDPKKLKARSQANQLALKDVSNFYMKNGAQWCVVCLPEEKWAKKVFPDLETSEAMDKLFYAIMSASRVNINEDPIENWNRLNKQLADRSAYLNNLDLDYLHYEASNGTNFKIGLAKDHIWMGGEDVTPDGVGFNPNIPSEEIFTAPDKNRIDGKVVASLPLNLNGSLVKDFYFIFKDGKVVDFDAKEGKEILKNTLESDSGAKSLGEVALVEYNSPISMSKILFYETLYDENASCHLALGQAYATNVKGGGEMTDEELSAHGVNDSLIHVDFMIGTKDLKIDGYKKDGTKVSIFKNGNFVF